MTAGVNVPLRERRAARLRGLMADAGMDVLVVITRGHITQYGDVEFLCGYTPVARVAFGVLGREGDPVLIVPTPADRWYATRGSNRLDVRVAGEGNFVSAADAFAFETATAIYELAGDGRRVGVAGLRTLLSVGEYEVLRDRLDGLEIVDASDVVAQAKLIKEPEDVDELVRTAQIADAAVDAARNVLRPGIVDTEVHAAIREVAFARGARDELIFVSADPYFLSWSRGREFAEGDLVTIYVEIVGPTGYWVECGCMLALGEPDREQRRVADAVSRAAAGAESLLGPGTTAGEVARAIDAIAVAENLSSGIWHGHGIGVDHDRPVITATDHTELIPGMVLSVHPNFATADERYGAGAVGPYLIVEDGCRRLSRISQGVLS